MGRRENIFIHRPENIFLSRSTTYDPANYEFSICRMQEGFCRCCAIPIENLIRKLHYKVNSRLCLCTLTIRNQELKNAYPYTMPAEDLQPAVLSFLNKCQYSDYENVTINLDKVQTVWGVKPGYRKRPVENFGAGYLQKILSSGWQPYYLIDSIGYVSIIKHGTSNVSGDNSGELQIDVMQVRFYLNRPKLYSSFMKAVSHGCHLLPPELWDIIFQYYVCIPHLI